MSTWQELREEVLTHLDVRINASTDDDIRNAVDIKMRHVRDRLFNLRIPDALLVPSSTVTLDENTEHIKIVGAAATNQPSFTLTDFRKGYALMITEGADAEPREWSFVRYGTWIREQSAIAGDQRYNRSYTIDYQNFIYLKTWPSTGETWTAQLYYMKEPAAITDLGEPEIGKQHEELLVLETVLGFPNRFISEERLALYASIKEDVRQLRSQYMSDSPLGRKNSRMKPFVRKYYRRGDINWGM